MTAALIALGALAGAIAGSFLSTLVQRWSAGRGLGGRSACDACGAQLRARDLVPVLSSLALKGRCRTCRAPFDPLHLRMEMACAVIGAVSLAVAPGLSGAAGALFGWTLLTLAILDLRHFWLPDRLVLALAGLGVVGALIGLQPHWIDRAIGAAAGYLSLAAIAFGYRLWRKREGLGGGDPKLFGAIGVWLGWQPLPLVLVGASVIGLLAVAIAMLRGTRVDATTQVPLGTLLAVAAYAAWVWTAVRGQ